MPAHLCARARKARLLNVPQCKRTSARAKRLDIAMEACEPGQFFHERCYLVARWNPQSMPEPNLSGIESRQRSIVSRLLNDQSIRSAVFAFAVTRIIILFVLLLSANMRFEPAVR